jgi:hypothetical protein
VYGQLNDPDTPPWNAISPMERLEILEKLQRILAEKNPVYHHLELAISVEGQGVKLRGVLRTQLVSLSSREMFKLYYTLESVQGQALDPHPDTTALIHSCRSILIKNSLPLANLITSAIEQKYRERYPGSQTLHFPIDIVQVIAEYACEKETFGRIIADI